MHGAAHALAPAPAVRAHAAGRRARRARRYAHQGARRATSVTRIGYETWARYYAPTWGRFISEDRGAIAPASPYRFVDRDLHQVLAGKNLYVYANDSPLVFTDPLGLYPICPPGSHPQFDFDQLCQNIYEDRERYYFFGLSCLVVQNPFLTPIFCGGLGATAGNNVNNSYVCVQDHP